MGRAILLSIQPKWCEVIASGKKTIEVRKSKPKLEAPFKVYIYCTKDEPLYDSGEKFYMKESNEFGNGKVIGDFLCDRIDRIGKRGINNNFDYCYLSLNEWGNDDVVIEITDIQKSCISKSELNAYGANSSCLYAWHISDLKIYDKPKCRSEFSKYGFGEPVPLKRPPQSWMYVEALE